MAMRTTGHLKTRARDVAQVSGYIAVPLVVLVVWSLSLVQPSFQINYDTHPLGYGLPTIGFSALAAWLFFRRRDLDLAAFLSSSVLILGLLGSTAWGSYPNLLIATTNRSNSLTVTNASAGTYGLQAAFWWFTTGLAVAIAYQVYIHLLFRGPVDQESSRPAR
jgi:cytochrome d ubiquinol oxidase subunit II